MNSSYSQNNIYRTCPMYWKWSYIDKLKSPEQSAALYFGSAVDDAIMANLEGKENYMEVFYSRWTTARGYGNNPDIQLFDNDKVSFISKDFDADLLKPEDKKEMISWLKTLRLSRISSDPLELFSIIIKNKRNPYKKITNNQLRYFNRCCWLSMKRKGEILIDSFITQFKPKIKKVHATQKAGRISENGHSIFGYLDFIAEIKGYDKPIIFDLKTAARPYNQAKIDLTEQLTLYYAMAGEEYKTDYVGYVVLSKEINKNEKYTCKSCGNIRAAGKRHKTCDITKIVKGKKTRCHGEWEVESEIAPEVQVLVQQKTKRDKEELLKDYNNIMKAMDDKIIYRNTDKCTNWYGGVCSFYDACHKDDTTGLVKK